MQSKHGLAFGFALLFVTAIFIFNGCKEEDPPPPVDAAYHGTYTVISGSGTVKVQGDSLVLGSDTVTGVRTSGGASASKEAGGVTGSITWSYVYKDDTKIGVVYRLDISGGGQSGVAKFIGLGTAGATAIIATVTTAAAQVSGLWSALQTMPDPTGISFSPTFIASEQS